MADSEALDEQDEGEDTSSVTIIAASSNASVKASCTNSFSGVPGVAVATPPSLPHFTDDTWLKDVSAAVAFKS